MRDRAYENLIELLRRFMDEPTAKAAHEAIETGEGWLEAYPAPAPDTRVIAVIKARMAVSALRRHRVTQLIRASLTAAAAVIVLALIGLFSQGSGSRTSLFCGALMPTALWDSDDITADDLDLAYFSSEIGQIEAQMQALDGDESELGVGAPEELEMELMAIQTEFLKG
jgi:hypothetical protein